MAEVTDEKIVDEVVVRLAPRYPEFWAPSSSPSGAWDALKAFVNPAIRDFLPVLVERRVVRDLRSVSQ